MSDYMRGYQKGRYAMQKKMEELLRQADQSVERARRRAERAEAGLRLGRCDACEHWRRHHSTALWGPCLLSKTWRDPNWPWRGDNEQVIHTKENFGCIHFEPKENSHG